MRNTDKRRDTPIITSLPDGSDNLNIMRKNIIQEGLTCEEIEIIPDAWLAMIPKLWANPQLINSTREQLIKLFNNSPLHICQVHTTNNEILINLREKLGFKLGATESGFDLQLARQRVHIARSVSDIMAINIIEEFGLESLKKFIKRKGLQYFLEN